MGSYTSMLKTGKMEPTIGDNTIPSLVLDNACVRETDRMCYVMGKVKEFGSIPNLYILLAKEGFSNLTISYLGGMWANPKFISEERIVWVDIEGIHLHARTTNIFMRIRSKWGDVMTMKDLVKSALYQKRLCIKTKLTSIIFESFKVIVQGKVYWARAKEMHGWNLVFCEDKYGYNSSGEESMGVGLEGIHGDTTKEPKEVNQQEVNRNVQSQDPFDIYELLNKKKGEGVISSEDNLRYPPGFTYHRI
ncbi:hypothetical protein Tco_0312095 [Tanacetum coccineum]